MYSWHSHALNLFVHSVLFLLAWNNVTIPSKSMQWHYLLNTILFLTVNYYKIHYHYVTCVFLFSIRDELKRHYTLGDYWVEVEMEDLASFDEDLSDCLYKLPTENLPLVKYT